MQNTKKDEWKNYTPKKRYPYALSAKKIEIQIILEY